jgi:hypothetical protein
VPATFRRGVRETHLPRSVVVRFTHPTFEKPPTFKNRSALDFAPPFAPIGVEGIASFWQFSIFRVEKSAVSAPYSWRRFPAPSTLTVARPLNQRASPSAVHQ